MTKPLAAFAVLAATSFAQTGSSDDPFLWLEDVGGAKPLAWVKEQNARSHEQLETLPEFAALEARLLAIYDSNARIPAVTKRHGLYYNFWRDAQHVRGIWRRTTLEEYRKPEPTWETVLDLDALAANEKENWVWKNAEWLRPDETRCLVTLSRGGADAVVIREFDPVAKQFVADGFVVPEAKSDIAWRDRDTIYIGTNFGADSLTTSGYPRIVKEWRRGTPLTAAKRVFEAKPEDVAVSVGVDVDAEFRRELITRAITFFTTEKFVREGAQLKRLELPLDAGLGTWREYLFVTLRSDWQIGETVYPTGALLVTRWDDFLAGKREFKIVFEPGPRKSLAGYTTTRHHLIVNELVNVRNQVFVLTPRTDGSWARERLATPEFGSVSVAAIDPENDDTFLSVTDFLTPTSLLFGTLGGAAPAVVKQLPAFFDAAGLVITQHEASSRDGTRVPYFQVAKKDLPLNGEAPTLLYGYGGFRISQVPNYSAGLGAGWLEKGGVYVLANTRGGGEFGPRWHEAGLKQNRQRVYDDFAAIAEDLIARRVTSPAHLGIMGGSNGGLLVGVMLTQRPELFGAVVCQVPLLDMKRYNHLLAGASWMGEYGNPDLPEEWAYLSRYSPYQNVRAGVKYPPVLFTTSTRDDRVHPGHARKMVAKMTAQGHDVLYYENTEGGHAGAANNRQQAHMNALAYTFLWRTLK